MAGDSMVDEQSEKTAQPAEQRAETARQDARKAANTARVKAAWRCLVALLVLAAAFAGWMGWDGSQVNGDFRDGAAVLLLITGLATGIERTLEAVWAWVDKSTKSGPWWPLSIVTNAIVDIETTTDSTLREIVGNVDTWISEAGDLANDASDLVERRAKALSTIQAELETAAKSIQNAQANLAPGSERFAIVAKRSDLFVRSTRKVLREQNLASAKIEEQLAGARRILDDTGDVIAAFTKNPARKTMSLAMGMVVGLLVAGILRINVVTAVLGAENQPTHVLGWAGVMFTGAVIGLGSSPTHEVIRALQRTRDEKITIPASADLADDEGLVLAALVHSQHAGDSPRLREIRRTT